MVRAAQIEGDFEPGARILLVEDLTTDGQSKLRFCQALRDAGAVVTHTFVIFHYDIFPQTKETFESVGLEMLSLATWWDVLKVCRADQIFDKATLKEVESFLKNPIEWSSAHGGASSLASVA